MPDDLKDRLRQIEQRLAAIESRLGITAPAPPPPIQSQEPSTPTPLPDIKFESRIRKSPEGSGISATTVLGWGGVAALVLAAAYLIRLAIDSGFLTPERQVAMAGTFGIGLIVTGLLMRDSLRRYGSLLPAGGVAVLFLTVYGAHLHHKLIGATPAAIGIIAICLVALALREFYKNELYTFFAVVGSYTGPFLLHILAARPLDLIIYFGAWDLLFCVYAIRARWRSVYLLSAYLAFIVFDATWRSGAHTDWVAAAGFQAVQFVLFLTATVWYSITHLKPLEEQEAVLHLPPLLFFYATEYGLLSAEIPDIAPWLALASTVPLLAAYLIAKLRMPEGSRGGEQIVAMYTAIALFHAGYMELIPSGWRELAGLASLLAIIAAGSRYTIVRRFWPISLSFGLAAFLGYARLATGLDIEHVVGWRVLIWLYAGSLYLAYWLTHKKEGLQLLSSAALYLAHVSAMAAIVHVSDSRLVVSIVWGLLAVASLVLSMLSGDRPLGRSALLVFAAFAAKVLLFDLSGASPLVRIGCLVVLGVTMYAGGLLYQRIDRPQES